ncbi:MAG TPA: BON domain-containing protein [Gemmataceae bacterium]|jgi:hypothetical protein|nr:BON domain-containing protein [Gemmataceae bacterium]
MRLDFFQQTGLGGCAGKHPVWPWKYSCWAAVLVWQALGIAPAQAFGAESAAARGHPPQTNEEMVADCSRMLFARQALQQDEELANFNLGVTIRGNVATLWGGIASPALSKRAEEKIRKVAGVRQVLNELRIDRPEEAKKSLFAQPAPPQPNPDSPILVKAPLAAGALTGGSGENRLDMKTGVLVRPAETKPTEAVAVMPPLVVSFRPNLTTDPPANPRPVIGKAAGDLGKTLQQMRMKEERFRQIQPEIKGGVIQLSGTVPRLEDMMEFAQAVARVPGVERVLLGEYRTPKNGSLQLP